MDPHLPEYAAAAAAIHDQTPRGCQLPAVGDYVFGESKGHRWCGRVQQMEPTRAVIEVTGAWLVVHPRDIFGLAGLVEG